jgi:hypothetical protein
MHELMGDVKRPAREFNRRCGPFWAEMAAVRVLAEDGFHTFKSLANQQDVQTSDCHAFQNQRSAYIEVKNLNPNDTVFDFLLDEIRNAYEKNPVGYRFHLVLTYPYDDPPTREQERLISAFIQRIRGRQTPFSEVLDLLKAPATIEATDGEGRAGLVS